MNSEHQAYEDTVYDFVIIGSGMAGLCCGYMLAKEGKKVIILEKNVEIGGNLQVFTRDKCVFDTGVHYLGSLDEGQSMNQFFKYLGILKDLKLQRLDENGFDRIHFHEEEIFYKYGMGYENFINVLSEHFPEERSAIVKYCETVKSIADNMPLSSLKSAGGNYILNIDLTLNAKKFIESITKNERLQKVLAGTNGLYSGSEKSPFYVHALILNGQIESSWRCVDGGSQIAKLISKRIHKFNGVIKKRHEVVGANFNAKGEAESVVLTNGKTIKGKCFISNMHPQPTIDIFGAKHFNKMYVDRIKSLENTMSSFSLHIVFHENTFEYLNYNIFQFNYENIWNMNTADPEKWPHAYFLTVPVNSKNKKFAKGASIIVRMKTEEIQQWIDSRNTTGEPSYRGDGYEEFKKIKSEKIIDAVEKLFPGIRKKIKSYSSSTPLTMRDYIGTPNGSSYGILKDSSAPLNTIINTKTSVSNLYLTGQNITLHGIYGVSVSALYTCFHFLNKDKLLKEIKDAE